MKSLILFRSDINENRFGRKIYTNYLLKNCTEEVLGEIVDIDSWYEDGHKTYTPVYEINYNGNKIKIKSDEYTNVDNYEIGRFDDLLINPLNPNEYIYIQTKIQLNWYIL